MNNDINPSVETIDITDLETNFLSLRIGEEIPELDIKEIRKIKNPVKTDNLPGVNYKYIIETTDNKLLTVNSWILWKAISQVLREQGEIQTKLYLKHIGREKYFVRPIY